MPTIQIEPDQVMQAALQMPRDELDLNREGVIRLRFLLLLNREHPPQHRLSM